jgi:hypothetical protein
MDSALGNKLEERDMEALIQWIRGKRLVTVKEIGGDLSLSGEVRTEMQTATEIKDGIKQRGPKSATNKPSFGFDAEVNLMLDYRTERTWASIKLEFDNDMGTQSGTVSKIALEKAYFGGRMIAGNSFTLDGELGRRYLMNLFESVVEFGSIFDGVVLKFNKVFDSIGDFYVNGGTFLINDRTNQLGYVAEMGLLRIGNTGFFSKCSLISWEPHLFKSGSDPRWNFLVGQALTGYQITPQNWQKLIKIYVAGLINFAAQKLPVTNYTYARAAWYAGLSVGKIIKKGDWAFDMNYQWVQAQAVPDYDSSGIKRGNTANVGMYTTNIDGTGKPTTSKNAVGNENFCGLQAEILYAITNSLTVLYNFKYANTLNKDIGPNLRFRQFEIEFIFAF